MIVLGLGRETFIFILVIFSLNYGAAEPEPEPQFLLGLTNLFLKPLGLSFGSDSPSGKDHLIM
jgi:hypothetical protein